MDSEFVRPKSDEPPALVLMRDHFAVCLSGSLVISSVLFFFLAFLITGMFQPQTAEAQGGERTARKA